MDSAGKVSILAMKINFFFEKTRKLREKIHHEITYNFLPLTTF